MSPILELSLASVGLIKCSISSHQCCTWNEVSSRNSHAHTCVETHFSMVAEPICSAERVVVQQRAAEKTECCEGHEHKQNKRMIKSTKQPQQQIMQKQIPMPMVQKLQNSVEPSQLQLVSKVTHLAVVMQRQVPTSQKIQETVEEPQVQFVDDVDKVPRRALMLFIVPETGSLKSSSLTM